MFDIQVTEHPRLKTASAVLRAGVIHVKIPQKWPLAEKQRIAQNLIRRVAHKERQDAAFLSQHAETFLTLDTEAALDQFVRDLNQQTFQVPLHRVRMGSAKYSRLAQMNIKTKTMTVSKYCLKEVPPEALRYLILHELAHLIEANHTHRFWALVEKFVPDYPLQSRVMKAFYRKNVEALGETL